MYGLREEQRIFLAQAAGRLVLPVRLKIHEEEGNLLWWCLQAYLFGNVCSPVQVRFWSSGEKKGPGMWDSV